MSASSDGDPRGLRALLASLLDPFRVGDEVAPHIRFVGASTELSLRLTFELKGRIVHVEVASIDEPLPRAARTERFALSYRTGSGSGGDHLTSAEGKSLCEVIATIAARNEERVVAAMTSAASLARESTVGSTRVREVRVSSLLESAEWHGTRYYTVSPYVGCLIGCRFCYAQSRVAMVRRLEGLPQVPWGSYVDVRVNAAEVLAEELATLPGAPIKFCPVVSDPYHAIEARFGVTRACLEALGRAPRPFPTMVLTRSRLIERDADVLAALPVAYAGVSIPTIDDDVRHHFEPRGSSTTERLDAVRTLRARGIRTFAVVQPMLPGPLDALADALAAHVDSATLDVLQSIEGASGDFADPRFRDAREPGWQVERALALREALVARGVVVWRGELPPELCERPPPPAAVI